MTFDDALHHFTDGFFDMVYIDGYAHTGQDAGKTLVKWIQKVRPGGILAGHDYDLASWPLTYHNVNVFVNTLGLNVTITSVCDDDHPSWVVRIPKQWQVLSSS
mmetsp:Transcript_14345/g.22249  ORF Transcript_14345/g.22249 Transcript_14345/m.22249 type:complete len:103 (-) Transcript_14345:59-367(-)